MFLDEIIKKTGTNTQTLHNCTGNTTIVCALIVPVQSPDKDEGRRQWSI